MTTTNQQQQNNEQGLQTVSREDLQTILLAWQDATTRLEQTHQILRDEVRHLTDELEIKNRELARKNRLADLGQMAAHIAHEVRNTLVPVSLYVSLLKRKVAGNSECHGLVEKISGGFTALEATVNDLLHFTADRDARVEPLQPATMIHETLDSLGAQFQAQCVTIQESLEDQSIVELDRELLRRAILNISLNALDVLPKGGTLHVSSHAEQDYWRLEFADNGPGWSDEALQRGTEPFFTTKHHGTGLGLAIVERIAEVHGGFIALHNQPTGGAVVTLCIPYLHTVQLTDSSENEEMMQDIQNLADAA
jgi:signal transduction histidine kinase